MDKSALEEAIRILADDRRDAASWTELYRLTRYFVLAQAFRRVGSAATAEDVSQEVFVRLVLYCPFRELRDGARFTAYLRAVVANVARDVRRQSFRALYPRISGIADSFVGLHDRSPSEAGPPSVDPFARRILGGALGSLGPGDRRLLTLAMAGWSMREIAAKSGSTEGAVAARLHRLKLKLRKMLKNKGLGGRDR